LPAAVTILDELAKLPGHILDAAIEADEVNPSMSRADAALVERHLKPPEDVLDRAFGCDDEERRREHLDETLDSEEAATRPAPGHSPRPPQRSTRTSTTRTTRPPVSGRGNSTRSCAAATRTTSAAAARANR
jgi:hypothetical protein